MDELTDLEKADIAAVFRSIPAARLIPYMLASHQDTYAALDLYGWNVQVAAALHETLAHFEIAFRNRIDEALTSRHKHLRRRGDWLDDNYSEFTTRASDLLFDARLAATDHMKKDIQQGKRVGIERGHIVAELTLGFWRRLLDTRYENVHGSAVMRLFPDLKRSRNSDMDNLRQLVDPLLSLRNRIAHHEPIWDLNHQGRRDDALRLIGITSPEMRVWVADRCRLLTILPVPIK